MWGQKKLCYLGHLVPLYLVLLEKLDRPYCAVTCWQAQEQQTYKIPTYAYTLPEYPVSTPWTDIFEHQMIFLQFDEEGHDFPNTPQECTKK